MLFSEDHHDSNFNNLVENKKKGKEKKTAIAT